MTTVESYFTADNRAPLSNFPRRRKTLQWPARTNEALAEMKLAARALGRREEASRMHIAGALIAAIPPAAERISGNLRAWRRDIWFAEPPIEEKQVGFTWEEPIFAKLALLDQSICDSGDRTNQAELTAFIVDTADLTTNGLRGLLAWYRHATVADVYVGRTDSPATRLLPNAE